MTTKSEQHRWRIYARSTDTPTRAGFAAWLALRWRDWEVIHGRTGGPGGRKRPDDHRSFDRWLEATG